MTLDAKTNMMIAFAQIADEMEAEQAARARAEAMPSTNGHSANGTAPESRKLLEA
jgi:hypothetical protein